MLVQQKIMETQALVIRKRNLCEGVYKTRDDGYNPICVHIYYSILENCYKVLVLTKRQLALLEGGFELEHVLEAEDVFIGNSPENDRTRDSGSYGPEFDGNTILLCIDIKKLEYVFIGNCMYSFIANAPITEFVSPIGENDFPYPYAIDKSGLCYLLILEHVVMQIPPGDDPYEYYHNINLATSCIFDNISEFYIDGYLSPLRYHSNTVMDRDLMLRGLDTGERSARIVRGSTESLESSEELTLETYQDLMKRIGEFIGAKPINITKVLW